MATPEQAHQQLVDAAASGVLDGWCDDLGIELLVVFGSVTDPDRFHAPRDIDVAIRMSEAGADLVTVVNALIDLTNCSDVDVLDLSRAGVVARARALGATCHPLYEARPGGFALAQMAALTEAMETAPMRRLDLELLAER